MSKYATLRAQLAEARAKRDRLRAELHEIAERAGDRNLNDGEQERWNRVQAGFENATADVEGVSDELRDELANLSGAGSFERGTGFDDERTAGRRTDAVRSQALRMLDQRGKHLSAASGDQIDRLVRSDTEEFDGSYLAQRIAITESDAYRSAYQRLMTDPQPFLLTGEEIDAVRALQSLERKYESRAAAEGTPSAGGYGVPVFIDPTVIVTSGAADAPILNVARVVPVTTNVWKGVSSAGAQWSYDAEGSEVSDDMPALAQPSVTVYTPRGFIPFSLEVGMDYPGFATEMSTLLLQGFVDLLASQTAVGSGSSNPRGIFTATAANTNVQVVTTTDGSFGAVDIFKTWNALPERYRTRATWLMSVSVESAIRSFSPASNPTSYFTVDMTAAGVTLLNGRPVIKSDYAPTYASAVPGTTGAANILVVGDFNNYVIPMRAGMSTELIPNLVGTNRRPTGQRGLFAWARHGADSVNDSGFRILQNQ